MLLVVTEIRPAVLREVIARRRRDGCLLVVDRDAQTRGDGQLVAQIAAEEPAANAALVCALYLRDAHRGRCRRVTVEDLIGGALTEQSDEPPRFVREAGVRLRHGLTAGDVLYRLEVCVPISPHGNCAGVVVHAEMPPRRRPARSACAR